MHRIYLTAAQCQIANYVKVRRSEDGHFVKQCVCLCWKLYHQCICSVLKFKTQKMTLVHVFFSCFSHLSKCMQSSGFLYRITKIAAHIQKKWKQKWNQRDSCFAIYREIWIFSLSLVSSIYLSSSEHINSSWRLK